VQHRNFGQIVDFGGGEPLDQATESFSVDLGVVGHFLSSMSDLRPEFSKIDEPGGEREDGAEQRSLRAAPTRP
jgi:hypothetical protein